jgi:ribosomal protein S18 acetylase RimI-like enzyme
VEPIDRTTAPDLFRPLSEADLPAAIALWRACEGIGLSDADREAELQTFLARNPGLSWAAIEGGALLGCVLAGHDGRRGFLYHLAVRSDARRRGLGRALATRALQSLRAEGIAKCHIMVYRDNAEGHAFWQRAGFSQRDEIVIRSCVLVTETDSCVC